MILASNSPRRKELLKKYGYEFRVERSDFNEVEYSNPYKMAKANALGKAESVYNSLKNGEAVVGADTIVYFKRKVFLKPKSEEDAINTLKSLSNKVHKVITGYAIISKKGKIVKTCTTRVKFNNLSNDFILEYVKSGKAMDKAGSYGAQEGEFVKKYSGSLNNVIGLPIEKMGKALKKLI